jgi:hypothetical protein
MTVARELDDGKLITYEPALEEDDTMSAALELDDRKLITCEPALEEDDTMPATLELDNGEHIIYESARKKDVNIINEVTYPGARRQLFQKLWDQRATIQDIVRHHLRLRDEDACIVKAENQWIRGSFNVCIPVEVRLASFNKNLIFRCPMPHKTKS